MPYPEPLGLNGGSVRERLMQRGRRDPGKHEEGAAWHYRHLAVRQHHLVEVAPFCQRGVLQQVGRCQHCAERHLELRAHGKDLVFRMHAEPAVELGL